MAAITSVVTPDTPAVQGTISLVGGQASKPWADTPFALIGDTGASLPSNAHIPATHYCREMAYTMALIHNTILRGVNSIYNQALHVKAGTTEAVDFLFYNQCVYDFLHRHHMHEEQMFFPLVRQVTGDPAFCNVELQEHEVFDRGAEKWKEYIFNVKSEEYDGAKLKSLIDDFGPPLHQHLVAEIAWLLTLNKYDSNACKKAMLDTAKKARAETSLSKDAPVILACQDASFNVDGRKGIFPSMPTPLLYMIKLFFARNHNGIKFAPSDVLGKRKELLAA